MNLNFKIPALLKTKFLLQIKLDIIEKYIRSKSICKYVFCVNFWCHLDVIVYWFDWGSWKASASRGHRRAPPLLCQERPAQHQPTNLNKFCSGCLPIHSVPSLWPDNSVPRNQSWPASLKSRVFQGMFLTISFSLQFRCSLLSSNQATCG